MDLQQQRNSEITKLVIDYCYKNLYDDKVVLNYLMKVRKLTKETIVNFKLGAFPTNIFKLTNEIDSWDLQRAGFLQHENGKPYSKFVYNRVIIPIFDVYDRPLGVIGRTLLGDTERNDLGIHKYDNTRFFKGSCLFGLNLAKDSIRQKNESIIVEGNFDVITAHQKGYTNVVASSGSWVTKNQFSLVGRYSRNINLMFDNDEEGRKSTKRLLEKDHLVGLDIKDMAFPAEFKDPDEYFGSLR